ncbi:Met-10+ like-protein-domain-containing protein [Roridomyces roridus]|uniref:tRNA (guanine(37)-N1)-methyltransferase n=1 Tax=Roridomyces roridus TaxID=1738132 RepID=A0AAD7FPS2_9AGAR|nr:Met-10+ like-protein-domain-containing protein [Roridomyces roridus]
MTIDASPPILTGLVAPLDKTLFRKSIPLLAARFPVTKIGSLRKTDPIRRSLIDLPRLRSIVPDPSDPSGDKLVLLKVSTEEDLPPQALEFLRNESNGLVPYTLELDYDYWGADEMIQAILPESLRERSPAGFAMTGHIAHINLKEEYLPYKYLIGQIILDKNLQVKTVVNKLDSIDTQFRFFKMELLAGEPNYIVQHHEADCTFTFDFTQVYWNSRLHTEHERLVDLFQPEDVVADVFAGVGPFAIPAARKGCAVLANDLNPQSAKYLAYKSQVGDAVKVSCEDGRTFIRDAAARLIADPLPVFSGPKKSRNQENQERRKGTLAPPPEIPSLPRNKISHFVMNLPDSAIQFLDAFRGVFAHLDKQEVEKVYSEMPMIHCHCFTRETEPEQARKDILERVTEKIGQPLEGYSLHLVRSVAPNKDMYCISFRLPSRVAFNDE